MRQTTEAMLARLRRWGLWARSSGAPRATSSLWIVMRQGVPEETRLPEVSNEEALETDRLIVTHCDETEIALLRARFIHDRRVRWIEEHLGIDHREFGERLDKILKTLTNAQKSL